MLMSAAASVSGSAMVPLRGLSALREWQRLRGASKTQAKCFSNHAPDRRLISLCGWFPALICPSPFHKLSSEDVCPMYEGWWQDCARLHGRYPGEHFLHFGE